MDTIITTQLKATDLAAFNVAEALDVITADIIEEIRKAYRGCSTEKLVFYFSENFPQNFTHGTLLVAECLADYYRTGEPAVTKCLGENYDPLDYHIKEFVVTEADLVFLLAELRKVQNLEHEMYQSWLRDSNRE